MTCKDCGAKLGFHKLFIRSEISKIEFELKFNLCAKCISSRLSSSGNYKKE